MTPEQAVTWQTYAAWVQTAVGILIGCATYRLATFANRILALQTEAQLADPAVESDIYNPWVADSDEPLNFVLIKNHSPMDLVELTLTAAIFGMRVNCPPESDAVIRTLGKLPNLSPHDKLPWCIDEFTEESLKLMGIGSSDTTQLEGLNTVFVRLHLKYRKKSDGKQFEKILRLAVVKPQSRLRGVAVYADAKV